MSIINMPANVLDDFYRPFGSLLSQDLPSRLQTETDSWMPLVDIRSEDNGFVIDMEVPGFTSDDINVEAHDGVLTIQGERSSEVDENKDNIVRRERHYGKFMRRFSLPPGTESDDIAAKVKDGMLHIQVPNKPVSTAKKITVD